MTTSYLDEHIELFKKLMNADEVYPPLVWGADLKLWWAYLHANGSVKVKGWWPVPPGAVDDRLYAQLEKEAGNDAVRHVLSKPFIALPEDAYERAVQLIVQEGIPLDEMSEVHDEFLPYSREVAGRYKDIG